MSTTPSTTSDSGLFRTAIAPFFHTAPQQALIKRFQLALQNGAAPEGSGVQWRPDAVTDFRGYNVPTGAERLVRWDYRGPNYIFYHGFEPPVAPRDQTGLGPSIADVGSYNSNLGTVFVSTVRYLQDSGSESEGESAIVRWVPRDMVHIYEYEVFASGGIDVQSTLGPSDFGQNDQILFPGGIRREFIRSARQYDKNGKLASIWYNPYFDTRETGAALYQLPTPICNSDSIDVHYWTGPTDSLQQKDGTAVCRVFLNAMRGEGTPTVDERMTAHCDPRPPRAAFVDPVNKERVYWFADNLYATAKVTATEDRLIDGPKAIASGWAALREARFGKIDAVLSTSQDNKVYFFSQDEYVLVDVTGGPSGSKIVSGPNKTASGWPSLNEMGCKTINAALPHPESSKLAYFFCGMKFALIGYDIDGTNRVVDASQDIRFGWPSLSQAHFRGYDTLLSNPYGSGEIWFFSQDHEYARIKFESDTKYVLIAPPKKVSEGLQSLKDAGFYGEIPGAPVYAYYPWRKKF